MSLVYYFYQSRREQNYHLRFGALFVTSPKSQIIFLTVLLLFLKELIELVGVRLGDFIFLQGVSKKRNTFDLEYLKDGLT